MASAARRCCRYGRDVCLDNKPLHVQASHSCTQLQCESLRWTFFFFWLLTSVLQNLFVTSFDKKVITVGTAVVRSFEEAAA